MVKIRYQPPKGIFVEELARKIDELREDFDKKIQEIMSRYGDLEGRIDHLEQLYNEKISKWGHRLGEDIKILCPGCGREHIIPYIPGRYKLCPTKFFYSHLSPPEQYQINWIEISQDGKISSYNQTNWISAEQDGTNSFI